LGEKVYFCKKYKLTYDYRPRGVVGGFSTQCYSRLPNTYQMSRYMVT